MSKKHRFFNINHFKYRAGPQIKNSILIYITLLTVFFIIISHTLTARTKVKAYNLMVETSQKMQIVYQEIHEFRKAKNVLTDNTVDPNNTGFIGTEFSEITTTLGNLDAKQTALNPDFAALMVKWINALNIDRDKNVIIHASASFPALTIMAIIACEQLNLEPVIMSSAGASSWGANHAQLTYLDIENHLYQKKIIKHRSTFVTYGGNNDNGSSLWEGGQGIINKSARRNNYQLNRPVSFENAINSKWDVIKKLKPGLFINIGGNHAAIGNDNCSISIPVGQIFEPLNCSHEGIHGLIYRCCANNIPVFHFLNIKGIALTNGILLTPRPFPVPGNSDLYYRKSTPVYVPVFAVAIIFLLLLFVRTKEDYYKTPSVSNKISTSLK